MSKMKATSFNRNKILPITPDRQLRYELLAPLFITLHENKIVYRERFIGIIKAEDVIITPERFKATAIPYLLIERSNRFDRNFSENRNGLLLPLGTTSGW